MIFLNERAIKRTRKLHQCCGCLRHIEPGSPAVHWVGLPDGDFSAVYYHPECREAEIELNKMAGTFGSEWIALHECDREDWPSLEQEHPAAYARVSGAAGGGHAP